MQVDLLVAWLVAVTRVQNTCLVGGTTRISSTIIMLCIA